MQIPEDGSIDVEVVDDCSTDGPEHVISRINDPRVSFYRQPRNVGHIANFRTAIDRAKGEVVHLLHGDDYVLPGFYAKMQDMYLKYPNIAACFTRHYFVDEDDDLLSISPILSKGDVVFEEFYKELILGQKIQTPSITVKRSIYDELGTFDPQLSWSEDWEMWVRITSKYPIGYSNNLLACYRMHTSSSTGTKSLTGENIKDLVRLRAKLQIYAKSRGQIDEFNRVFDDYLFNTANNNYIKSLNAGYEKAYIHLFTMASNAPSLLSKCKYFLKYLKSRVFAWM